MPDGRELVAQFPTGKAAIHQNHGLFTVGETVDEAAFWFISMERSCHAQAREARYGVFKRMLSEGDTLALAHHADDVAETLLLRLLRGSGTEALANMQMHSKHGDIHVWRPLLACNRHTLAEYAQAQSLVWIDDDSNADTGFDRNFLRHRILPLLEQRINAWIASGIYVAVALLWLVPDPRIERHISEREY